MDNKTNLPATFVELIPDVVDDTCTTLVRTFKVNNANKKHQYNDKCTTSNDYMYSCPIYKKMIQKLVLTCVYII